MLQSGIPRVDGDTAMFRRAIAPVLFVLVALSTGGAYADRIDGHWCKGLKRLYIDGPQIVTPGGTKMTGDYDRHAFTYVVPAGEDDAGATITMQQMHEELMQWQSSSNPSDVQDWIRCNEQISRLTPPPSFSSPLRWGEVGRGVTAAG
jgi:hypothetical protein